MQFGNRWPVVRADFGRSRPVADGLRERREFFLELTAEHDVDAERAQPFLVQRRV